MIIVEGVVEAAADEIARLAPALAEMAAATRQEPGCLDYAFSVEIGRGDVVRVAERWRDEDALNAHFTTPHMARFNGVLAGAKLSRARVVAYTASELRTLVSI